MASVCDNVLFSDGSQLSTHRSLPSGSWLEGDMVVLEGEEGGGAGEKGGGMGGNETQSL